ncbi:hypothetical protein [Paraburkholderia strydomiana]|uniref:hypothetical protein n=1 Tax=Paraburkholderia strydomiana TaxID=1245417 RepID=UPI0038B7BB0A
MYALTTYEKERDNMTASAAVATSAIHAASAAASTIGDGISSGVWSFLGGLVGAAVAVGLGLLQQRAQGRRERVKMATDSAGSHMANVAFDKYVEFCETYKDEAGDGVLILIRHGPTPEILSAANKLTDIRFKHSLWIPSEVDARLKEFEQVWRHIGAYAGLTNAQSSKDESARLNHVDFVYKEFAKVMGLKEWMGEVVTDEFTVASIVAGLREVLGTEKLSKLRRRVLERSISDLDD